MATTEELQAQLDALRQARAGVTSQVAIRADGSVDVTNKSDAELAAAIAAIEGQLSGAPVHTIKVWSSKGFDS